MSQTGRRLAILIGSSKFDKEPLKDKPLKCPERDVDGMHELLAAAELGAFGEVFIFKNSHHQDALDQIEEVLTSAARNDQVLIYYSGHGETDLPGRLYLTATNTDTKKLVSTSIPIDTLRTMIENSACKKIILILDCCFGGAAGKSFVKGSVDEKLKELARGYGIYILTASTAAQTAQEREGDDYGLLTKHIISGIKEGAAANDDGLINMDGLYRYVYAQVTSEGYQEPMHWALNVKGEDLIIARSSKSPIRERQRLLTEKIIEIREFLPRSIFNKAFQVIDERREPYYELIDELYRQRLQLGEFVDEWHRLESAERQQSPPPPKRAEITVAPTEPAKPHVILELQPSAPINKSSNEGVLKRTEITAAPAEPAPLPVITEPPPSPPAVEPSSESVQSTAFSRKPVTTSQQPEGGILNTFGTSKLPEVKTVSAFVPSLQSVSAWSLRTRLIIGSAIIGMAVLSYIIYSFSQQEATNTNPSPTPVSTSPDSGFTENLNGIKLEMVYVPGGTFKMGSPQGKGNDDETPQHDVAVPSFSIGKYEITQAQWKAVMGSNNLAYFKGGDNLPVENVSWNDAKEFCKKLSQMTGKEYRLPTEAEWEYACRAKTTDNDAGNRGEMAWYNANSGTKTHLVGQKKQNAFGLHDMHGNVWEWCEDVWHGGYKTAPTDGSAWLSGGDSSRRVFRGGSWDSYGDDCRSASRSNGDPGFHSNNVGFRVVVATRSS